MPKGARYAEGTREVVRHEIENELPYFSFPTARAWYRTVVPHLNKQEIAYLAANDRFFLLTAILRRRDADTQWVYERSREVEADTDGYIDLWARYHYKSTIITFAGSIQEIINDPDITIAIFGYDLGVSRPFLEQIKRECEENELLTLYFPDVFYQDPKKQSSRWSMSEGIIVRRKNNPKEATVSAFGLMEGLPTGGHWGLLIFNDVVTMKSVTQTDSGQIQKTWLHWEQAQNLGTHEKMRRWIEGTRYCSIGSMRITMGDWTQRPIADVRVGDTVVGWEMRDGKRYLRPAKVVNRGVLFRQPVNRYRMTDGPDVVTTADHRWWRGAWGSGEEYQRLALPQPVEGRKNRMAQPRGSQPRLRRLMVPVEASGSRDAGWLAGFFDGEGTVRKNPNHPSGVVTITQSMANPELVEETRRALAANGFEWGEIWHQPKEDGWNERCNFTIAGGWKERYRFLAEIAPRRREKVAATLFGNMKTSAVGLVSVEDAGEQDVHWLETETGNYIVEGYCSSNSFADAYGTMMRQNSAIPRIYPATHDGTMNGRPVFLSDEKWAEIKRDQRLTLNAQQLLNPLAGEESTFLIDWLRSYELRPINLTVWIIVDPAQKKSDTSDRTAMVVVGMDSHRNFYLLDGYCHRMKLSEKTDKLLELDRKWRNAPGVQMVRTGYERYGMQTDIEHIELEVQRRNLEGVSIEEVNWVRDGPQAKAMRIRRLEPDFRNSGMWLPKYVWLPRIGKCTWHVEWKEEPRLDSEGRPVLDKMTKKPILDRVQGSAEVIHVPYVGPSRQELAAQNDGELYRILDPIRRLDEDGNIYDLTSSLMEEYRLHPFGAHEDLLDALSRVYDMDPTPPVATDAMRQAEEKLAPDE